MNTSPKPTGYIPWAAVPIAIIWLLLISCALADDPAPSAGKELQRIYQTDAAEYHFFMAADRQHPLKFISNPVMHWASPNDWSGDVFVWTQHGRPEIIGCILSGPRPSGERMIFHEFHALTLRPLPPQTLAAERTWTLTKPALEFKPLDNAPPPAESTAARLTQMRTLSREFTCIMQAGDQPWELRLLPQPIYRYDHSGANDDWLDGGLFTFVWTTGTDAEMILAIEARKHGDGYRWEYAPVRLTNREVTMKHRDRVVWEVPVHSEPEGNVTGPYTTFYVRTISLKSTTE